MSTITKEMIINDVINKHPATIKVFNDFKVDSRYGGGAPIGVTGKKDGVDVDALVKALNVAVETAEGECGYCGDPKDKKI